ncbi:hypothetical protein BpHYR1_023079 [Brachionus plicatilis]|uniref:Uncharacterized protein n=1 Tax=Brachionus plicatilis TaxID=10195 RepID=A0A3M7PGQ6_BRAPC|nr:hypothetical protein BpHYR1_023079 [Brachionus plicatilis]
MDDLAEKGGKDIWISKNCLFVQSDSDLSFEYEISNRLARREFMFLINIVLLLNKALKLGIFNDNLNGDIFGTFNQIRKVYIQSTLVHCTEQFLVVLKRLKINKIWFRS